MPIYADLTPTEAVTAARRDADAGVAEVWEALDGCLRWHLLSYLQDRDGDPAELREALLEAADWARQDERPPYCHTWPYLLEMLRDAERLPSTAGSLRALEAPEGRAAELLALVVDKGEPVRPGELAEQLGLSPQQVTNLGRRLEDAGLIVRRQARGRATWVYATPRALDLAPHLPRPEHDATARASGPVYEFWPAGSAPIPQVH